MARTLAEAYQYASQFIRLAPLTFASPPAGSRANDPSLSIGDWVRNTILAPPFYWRWNRATTPLGVLTIGLQDYSLTFAPNVTMTNATNVTIASNLLTITSAAFGGTTVYGAVVTFSGFAGPQLSFLNNTTATVISSTATTLVCSYQHGNLAPTAASGTELIKAVTVASFGWLEKASVTFGGVTKELEIKMVLGEESTQNQPHSIACQTDDGAGNLSFRIMPAPDKAYSTILTYQKLSPNFAATSDTWAPIPDYMFNIVCEGVLCKAYEYLGDERYPLSLNKFLKQLIGFHGGLKESEIDLFLGERLAMQTQAQGCQIRTQQGVMSRGLQ